MVVFNMTFFFFVFSFVPPSLTKFIQLHFQEMPSLVVCLLYLVGSNRIKWGIETAGGTYYVILRILCSPNRWSNTAPSNKGHTKNLTTLVIDKNHIMSLGQLQQQEEKNIKIQALQ